MNKHLAAQPPVCQQCKRMPQHGPVQDRFPCLGCLSVIQAPNTMKLEKPEQKRKEA